MPSSDTQFKPGQSGNPLGRPKSKPLRDALLRIIEERGADEAALALYSIALSGDVPAFRELADRIEGKVAQAIVGDEDHDAIQMNHTIQRVIVDPNTNGSGSTTTP